MELSSGVCGESDASVQPEAVIAAAEVSQSIIIRSPIIVPGGIGGVIAPAATVIAAG